MGDRNIQKLSGNSKGRKFYDPYYIKKPEGQDSTEAMPSRIFLLGGTNLPICFRVLVMACLFKFEL